MHGRRVEGSLVCNLVLSEIPGQGAPRRTLERAAAVAGGTGHTECGGACMLLPSRGTAGNSPGTPPT